MTSCGDLKTMNGNAVLTPHLYPYVQKRFPEGRWSFFGAGSEKKLYSTYIDRPREEWDRVAELMMIKFRESGHPVFRATSPLSRGTVKSKGSGKLSIHFCADGDTIETVFRTIMSVNQLGIYGAVSDLCDEYRACQARTARLVVAEQSDPHFAPADLLVTTSTPSTEVPAQENLLQNYREQVEKLQQPDRVIKICTDAGFLTTVEVGQYFMTKDTEEFSQFTEPETCRACILPRDEKSSDPKGWIRGNTKIGPVMEVTTSYLQGKYGVVIRIESVNKRQFSLVGSEFLLDWISWSQIWSTKRTTTTSRRPLRRSRKNLYWKRMYLLLQADQRLKHNHADLPLLAHLQELYLFVKEYGLILSQELNRISLTQRQKD